MNNNCFPIAQVAFGVIGGSVFRSEAAQFPLASGAMVGNEA